MSDLRGPRIDADSAADSAAATAQRRLAWPDKAGLVIAGIVVAISIYACVIVLLAGETLSYGRLNHTLALWTGLAVLAGAMPIWLLLRIVDVLAGGPWRRRRAGRRRGAA